VAQLVAQLMMKQQVTGSIPSINVFCRHACMEVVLGLEERSLTLPPTKTCLSLNRPSLLGHPCGVAASKLLELGCSHKTGIRSGQYKTVESI
jgi:hypothetical protein